MTTLAYRNMNWTLARRAQEGTMEVNPTDEPVHYWHIQRKSKRGKKWIYVQPLYATKRDAADLFVKHFRNRTDFKFRLRHILAYSY